MNSNDEIFNKIQASLQAARDTIQLKEKIESDISEVLYMVSKITGDAIHFDIIENDEQNTTFVASDKLIFIYKASSKFNGFILCGYSIDEMSGYPVNVEDENNIATCNDDTTLKTKLSDFITSKENSMRIINLISASDDIPF